MDLRARCRSQRTEIKNALVRCIYAPDAARKTQNKNAHFLRRIRAPDTARKTERKTRLLFTMELRARCRPQTRETRLTTFRENSAAHFIGSRSLKIPHDVWKPKNEEYNEYCFSKRGGWVCPPTF